jgi:hypothetical protein
VAYAVGTGSTDANQTTLRQRGMHAQLRPLEKGRRAAAVVVMRTCKRDFPGADQDTSERLAAEVAADERAIVDALGALREDASISREAVGYLMGTQPRTIVALSEGHNQHVVSRSRRTPMFLFVKRPARRSASWLLSESVDCESHHNGHPVPQAPLRTS